MSEWFEAADLLPLWLALHARLSSGAAVSSVRVGSWSDTQRQAVADLLGLDRVPPVGSRLALSELDAALAETGLDSRFVVEQVAGPLSNQRAQKQAAATERVRLWEWLESAAGPALAGWVTYVRGAGLVNGSVERTRNLLEKALAVLSALPADGVPLAVFADRVLGDPHALDDGTRLTTLVLRAVTTLLGECPEQTREAWRRMGVEGDALSSTVLVAGFRPAAGPGSAAAQLGACAAAGEAAVLTLQQVRSTPELTWPAVVHVVENPSVMASALARFGPACPALVCVSGWPSAAGMLLLRRLSATGSQVLYHGDLDGDGLRIANHVISRAGARPWRMSSADYERALARRAGGPPAGRVTDTPWDSGLGPLVRQHGTAVTEEAVINDLIDDLENCVMGFWETP